MDKPTLTILCGLPGSGKSTYAQRHPNKICVSSDKIREKFGNIDDQSNNNEVFSVAFAEIKKALKSGNDVIFDACNITRKSRRSVLHQVNGIDCYKKCVIIYQPIEICKRCNAERDRTVPEEVIDRMFRSFNTPARYEGFDEIEIFYRDYTPVDYMNNYRRYFNFNQENSHHRLTLGEHQMFAKDYILKNTNFVENHMLNNNEELVIATMIHDCGKPLTKEYDENKGEYRYFNHDNVGSYLALGYDYDGCDTLYISLLINLHMQPYHWNHTDYPELTAEKYKKRWGETLYNNIMLLHEADVVAH